MPSRRNRALIVASPATELLSVLSTTSFFRPVWVLAALADASGTGRYLIREIAAALKDEGLLDRTTDFASVDQMLDGLEASAGRLASAINTPPLDVNGLRDEWRVLQADLARLPPQKRPPVESLERVWDSVKREAQTQNRTPFQISSLLQWTTR